MSDLEAHRYADESLQKLAFWTRWTWVFLALSIPFILFDLFESAMFVGGGFESWSYETATNYDAVSMIVSYVNLGIALVCIAIFGRWIYVAAANLVEHGIEQFEYSPGWSVGWYFIPIANLFKPFQAMRQIWNGSHGLPDGDIDANHALLTIWWVTWLAASITGNISFRLFLQAESYEDLYSGYSVLLVSSLISLVLYPVAIRLVTRINTAQQSWTDYRVVFD